MNITNMKNIVVLKNLPSNLVEEAIVVLKANKKIRKLEYIDKKNEAASKEIDSKDYILKEAEMIISNFISNVEKIDRRKSPVNNITAKYRRLKIITIVLCVITFINLVANFSVFGN